VIAFSGSPHSLLGRKAVDGGADWDEPVFLIVRGAELFEEHAAKSRGRLLLFGCLRGERNSEQEEECKLSHGCNLVVAESIPLEEQR
jgi:hypothetical protein